MIVVSTHFDDGIGSCAGALQRCLSQGDTAQVWTVMSRPPWLPFIKHFALSLANWRPGEPAWLRAREDFRACRELGVERREVGFVDALYRRDDFGRRLYRNGAALRGPVHPHDESLAGQIAESIDQSHGARSDLLAFPLAIGNHVDHQICARAGLVLSARGRAVIFYRDFHYQGPPGEAQSALKDAQWWRCTLAPAEVRRKTEAFEAYSTQIAPLYGSLAQMRQTICDRESTEDFLVPAGVDMDRLERLAMRQGPTRHSF